MRILPSLYNQPPPTSTFTPPYLRFRTSAPNIAATNSSSSSIKNSLSHTIDLRNFILNISNLQNGRNENHLHKRRCIPYVSPPPLSQLYQTRSLLTSPKPQDHMYEPEDIPMPSYDASELPQCFHIMRRARDGEFTDDCSRKL